MVAQPRRKRALVHPRPAGHHDPPIGAARDQELIEPSQERDAPVSFTEAAVAALRAMDGVYSIEGTPDSDGRYASCGCTSPPASTAPRSGHAGRRVGIRVVRNPRTVR